MIDRRGRRGTQREKEWVRLGAFGAEKFAHHERNSNVCSAEMTLEPNNARG